MKDRMLQFFAYDHLPELLQEVSKPFHTLAYGLVDILPSNPERTVALRKLLEAKDCAVRALLYKEPESPGGAARLPVGTAGTAEGLSGARGGAGT